MIPSTRIPEPLRDVLDRIKLAETGRSPEETLRQVSVTPLQLQDYRPLSRTLEWELSDLHWSESGVLPFAENAVPFIVNNSGRLSEDAAAVLYANCLESEPGERILLLELGAGAGLFARYFLDAFRLICSQEGGDFYERVTYCVTDRSRRTAEQWQEREIFCAHAGRVIMGTCDASQPVRLLTDGGEEVALQDLRAVFCNYMLDVLPASVIRAGNNGSEELCVRTHLTSDRALLQRYTNWEPDRILELAATDDPTSRARLIPLLPAFEYETAFRPSTDLPYCAEALEFGKGCDRTVLNHGAIACLETCLARLHPAGFVLINDYGPVRPDQVADQAGCQRFGPTTALPVNFPFLERHFTACGAAVAAAEDDDKRPIHTRLLMRAPAPRTLDSFKNRFGPDAREYFEAPLEQARAHAAAGRKSEALESYRAGLARNARNWHVVGEVAEYVAMQLRDYAAGLELARAAVALNPWYSPWLWNALGDCLYCLERYSDAHEAYLQARRIDPNDPRTNLNLAYTWLQKGDYREALAAIATGLERDAPGLYRQRLLEKQQHVLAAISERWAAETAKLAERASRLR